MKRGLPIIVLCCAVSFTGMAPSPLRAAPPAAAYVGSTACAPCHGKDHGRWQQTWHAAMHRELNPAIVTADFNNVEITYKDVEVEGPDRKKAKISPTIRLSREGDSYRFTLVDRDNPANNQTYEIAYVLGGNWNQHFEARVGGAYYPTPMRWVVEDGQWTSKPFNDMWWVADGTPDGRPKKPEEMPKAKTGDATCDGCHTTGFNVARDRESGRWAGQKRELGVGCESCHGPGSVHAATKRREDIVNPAALSASQQDQVCGQCHSRVTNRQEKDLAYPTGFMPGMSDLRQRVTFWTYSANPKNFWPNGFSSKNRQQYHDVQFTSHARAGVSCITCHDAHAETKGNAQLRQDKKKLCVQCHKASAALYQGSAEERAGVGCCDCHMARIANRSDPTPKRKQHWDVSSHTFAVVMPRTAEALKMKSSCDACHEGADKAAKGDQVVRRQIEIRNKIAEVEKAMAVFEKNGTKAHDARKLLAAVKEDRSFGAHNPHKAMQLLQDALKSVATE
ncbi:multiheme c-type cytochrome [Geobacter sp. FeAm09]|uniref:multiheme c-type cytochrome n=1 Tax=Geobacter sp. FeAm09 TaxID=2597769 RepID=UPI00143D206A|nr:multiheme c-type cytochrome [Geobacter sp. FeAm09]